MVEAVEVRPGAVEISPCSVMKLRYEMYHAYLTIPYLSYSPGTKVQSYYENTDTLLKLTDQSKTRGLVKKYQ